MKTRNRFNVRLSLEADESDVALLEVDKEANMTPEEKAIRDLAEKTEADKKIAENGLDADGNSLQTPEPTPTPGDADTSATPEPSPEPTPEPDEDGLSIEEPEEGAVAVDTPEFAEEKKKSETESESVDDAIDTATSLEAIANILYKSLDTGGMSPGAAQATNVVLEGLYARVGIDFKATKYPALESFDSMSARRAQTKIAIEGIGESVSRIWKAISNSIKRMIKRLRDMMSNFLFSMKSQQNQIRALKAAASKARKTEPTYTSYSHSRNIRQLSINGAFNPQESIAVGKALWHGARVVSLPEAVKSFGSVAAVLQQDFEPSKVYPLGLHRTSSDRYTNSFVSAKSLPGGDSVTATLPKSGLTGQDRTIAIAQTHVDFSEGAHRPANNVSILKKQELNTFIAKLEDLLHELNAGTNVINAACDKLVEIDKQFSSSVGGVVGAIVGGVAGLPIGLPFTGAAIGATAGHAVSVSRRSQADKDTVVAIRAVSKVYFDLPFELFIVSSRVLSSGINYANSSVRAYL